MSAPLILPVAEYAPDLPDAIGGKSSNIRNVYPRTPQSYGPVGQPSIYSDALTARCQGAAAAIDSAGNVNLIAGDATKLYRMTVGSTSWADVSKLATTYAIGSDSQWQYAYFNGDIIATDFVDPVQRFTLASSANFIDLSVDAPRARYMGVVKNAFLVLANTFDGVNGNMPQRVWRSAAGDHTSWPTVGTSAAAAVQSGATDLLGNAGWVQGIATDLANADAVIFQQYAVKRMMYVGPPDVFAFLPAENVRGTPAPYSIAVYAGLAYFLGQDGFYAFDGVASQPIGAGRIDRTVLADLDSTHITNVVSAVDPISKLIWWAYPGSGNTNGNPNRLLAYNWQLDRWSICDVECETICRMLSIGYTLDELYTILGYTLDTLPAPLDSALWTGGRLQLGLFDTAHKLNYLTGSPLAATVETQELQPFPGRRAMVRNVRPYVDGVGSAPSVKIGHRERMQDAVTYGPSVALNSMGACPQRSSGRYLRATITTAVGDAAWANISGAELDLVQQGSR